MNSNLIPPDEKSQIPVDFRIIGRDSWKEGGAEQPKKPSISWSIPFRWLWVMPQHIRKDLMTPLPFDLPSTADAKEGKVDVLKGFQKGSK